MYFQAFRPAPAPTIPAELLYTVEYVVSQLLTTVDLDFLHSALERRQLGEALWRELDFLGYVPRRYQPDVRAYVLSQEETFRQVAEEVLKSPTDEKLRARLCQPIALPPT